MWSKTLQQPYTVYYNVGARQLGMYMLVSSSVAVVAGFFTFTLQRETWHIVVHSEIFDMSLLFIRAEQPSE